MEDIEVSIKQGPDKLDLMLSLFDTGKGIRSALFQLEKNVYGCGAANNWMQVQIAIAKRLDAEAREWSLVGIAITPQGNRNVSILYDCVARYGRIRFENGSEAHGVLDSPDGEMRAKALANIIFTMITRYQKVHTLFRDDGIFKLFEEAKGIIYAEDRKSLMEAIKAFESAR